MMMTMMTMTMVIIRRAQQIVAANSNSKQQLLFKLQLSLTAALLDSRFPMMVMIMVMVRIICIFKNMHIGDFLQTTPAAQQHLAQTVNYAQV